MSLSCIVFEILTLICQTIKTSRDLDHTYLGTNTSRANSAQNLTILSSVISEKINGVQNSKKDHVTRATPLSGMISHPKANMSHSLQAYKI